MHSSSMATVTIDKTEYDTLKKKAEMDDNLLVSLVRGLEDIRLGKVRPWKRKTTA